MIISLLLMLAKPQNNAAQGILDIIALTTHCLTTLVLHQRNASLQTSHLSFSSSKTGLRPFFSPPCCLLLPPLSPNIAFPFSIVF